MKVYKEEVYTLQFSKADAEKYLELMDDTHHGNTPDYTLLYDMEDAIREALYGK